MTNDSLISAVTHLIEHQFKEKLPEGEEFQMSRSSLINAVTTGAHTSMKLIADWILEQLEEGAGKETIRRKVYGANERQEQNAATVPVLLRDSEGKVDD